MALKALEKQFELIHAATEKAIRAAKKADVKAAINWGDIGCTDVQLVMPWHEGSHWEVLIEEAAPERSEFHEFIEAYLAKHGFEHVWVMTEW